METRVTLLHNPGAGFEEYTAEELLRLLHQKGYDVSYSSTKHDYEDALKPPGDLIMVAGGDGTVLKIAKHLIGRNIPKAYSPLAQPITLLLRWVYPVNRQKASLDGSRQTTKLLM